MDWPVDLEPYRWEFYLQPNTRVFRSPVTRTRQVLAGQGERWVGSGNWRFNARTPKGRRRAQRFEALLDKMNGQVETVNIYDFATCGRNLGPNLDRTSIPVTPFAFTDGTNFSDGTNFFGGVAGYTVAGAAALGANTIIVDGFPAGTVQLYAGDYIGIGGFLYRMTEDATEANGMGRSMLSLNRGLVQAATNLSVVTTLRPTTPMQLVDDDQSRRSAEVGGIREYAVSFVECFFV